jgi:hypothetical protein
MPGFIHVDACPVRPWAGSVVPALLVTGRTHDEPFTTALCSIVPDVVAFVVAVMVYEVLLGGL